MNNLYSERKSGTHYQVRFFHEGVTGVVVGGGGLLLLVLVD